ncbi:MAG TPA: hypothetical protein VMJ32_06835 [Pirellulales bacterium]|nr:hypothetical protein [Pirellulales bacterium]
MHFAAIVRAYTARKIANVELRSFENEKSFADALNRAGMAMRPDGKRYDHQRRIPHAVLCAATSSLRLAALERATDFDSLFAIVSNAIGSIHGIGELTIYDTALRIGAKLGLLPTRVYLHSGTRKGARALNLNWHAPYLEVGEFPAELQKLAAHEIEDCLCIFKDRFRNVESR